MKTIRGAITSENTIEGIKEATVELLSTILSENRISQDEILFANFSATKDINKAYRTVRPFSSCMTSSTTNRS